MLNILLLIILSPIALICGTITTAIIYAMLDWIIKHVLNTASSMSSDINVTSKRDET